MKFRRAYSRSVRDEPVGASPILPPTSFMERPTLDQFLLLSILWHVLAIVLLGDTSGVGVKGGNRLWGAASFNFNATLNADNVQAESGLKLDKKIPTLSATSAQNRGGQQNTAAQTRLKTGSEAAPTLESAENAGASAAEPTDKNPLPAAVELPPVSAAASAVPSVAIPNSQTPPNATPENLPSTPITPAQSVTPEALRFIAQDVALPLTTFVVAQPAPPPEPVVALIPIPPPVVRAPSQSVAPVTTTSSLLATTALPSALTAVPTFNVAPPPDLPVPVPTPALSPIPERILVAPKMPKLESAPVEIRVALPPTPRVAILPPPITLPITQPTTPPILPAVPVEQKMDIKIEPRVAVKPPEVKPPEFKSLVVTPTEIKLPDIKTPEISVPAPLPTIAKQPVPPVPLVPTVPLVLDTPKLASPPSATVSPVTSSPTNPPTNPPTDPIAAPLTNSTPAVASTNAASSSQRALESRASTDSKADLKFDAKSDVKAAAGSEPAGTSALLPVFPAITNDATKPVPKLDLDALRNRARAITSEGGGPRTLLPFPVAPPVALKKKVEEIFDKALKRPDCKDVYADMGLAAVVPLVRDAITEKGCRW